MLCSYPVLRLKNDLFSKQAILLKPSPSIHFSTWKLVLWKNHFLTLLCSYPVLRLKNYLFSKQAILLTPNSTSHHVVPCQGRGNFWALCCEKTYYFSEIKLHHHHKIIQRFCFNITVKFSRERYRFSCLEYEFTEMSNTGRSWNWNPFSRQSHVVLYPIGTTDWSYVLSLLIARTEPLGSSSD